VKYPLPEYGEDAYVIIQEMTSKELVEIQTKYGSQESTSNLAFVHDVFSRTLTDDNGTRLFANVEDVEACLDISLPAMEALMVAVLTASGIETKQEPKN